MSSGKSRIHSTQSWEESPCSKSWAGFQICKKGGRDGLFEKPGHLSLAPEPTQRWMETTDSTNSPLTSTHVPWSSTPGLLVNNFGPRKMFQKIKVPAAELTTEFDPKDSPSGKRELTPTGLR